LGCLLRRHLLVLAGCLRRRESAHLALHGLLLLLRHAVALGLVR
jgi:hypothetical protein